jgi:hypothetical protein
MAPAPRPRRRAAQRVTPGYGVVVTSTRDDVRVAQRDAITASAVRVGVNDSDMLRRVQQGWQVRSFLYYEQCGEIWYAAQFYARALAKLELSVKRIDQAKTSGAEEDVDEESIQQYVRRIQDPGGGRANLLGAYGRLMFLTGEGYLLCTNPAEPDVDEVGREGDGEDDEDDGDEADRVEGAADEQTEQWEFLSTDELRPTGAGSFTRFKAPSLNASEIDLTNDDNWEPVEDTAVAYRFWRRHPRYSALADAPMRGVLDICEELLLLTMAIRARAVSRVSGAGILAVPSELSPPPLKPEGDENPLEDPFIEDLAEAMIQPIKDPGNASAVVPFVVRGPAEYLEKLRHIELSDPSKLYPETGLRTECIRRIAIGLDMPPEALIGTEDSNHWTAWSIDEQTWKAHLQPVAQGLVDDLTAAYLRPAMAADGIPNAQEYVVAYDASAVINHPDRTTDAKDLWDRLAISDQALRDAAGFEEDDAPDEEEWLRRAGFLMRDGSMAAYGIPGVRGNIEPEPGDLQGPEAQPDGAAAGTQAGAGTTPADSGGTAAPVPPATTQTPTGLAASAVVTEQVIGAMHVGVMRCRDVAGARLRSRCAGVEDAGQLIDGVPNSLVAAGLGRDRVAVVAPGVTARELVRGGGAPLIAALTDFGLEHAHAATLAAAVERHAAQTLYSTKPGAVAVTER